MVETDETTLVQVLFLAGNRDDQRPVAVVRTPAD